jgi:quinol monooxygenase YgiN
MVIRFVQVRIHDANSKALKIAYERTVIAALKKTDGCLSASLLQSNKDPFECVSMTVWKSEQQARSYEQSGLFATLVDGLRPYYAEATEWTIQLGDDLSVQYEPVRSEPAVQQYSVEIQEAAAASDHQAPPYVRVVSHRIRAGASAEFRQIYERDILPTLLKRTGCQRAYLVTDPGDPTKVLSVTVWGSKLDADEYERHGQFSVLLAKLQPTLSDLSQWKLDVGRGARVSTSDDVSVDGFELLVGEQFH